MSFLFFFLSDCSMVAPYFSGTLGSTVVIGNFFLLLILYFIKKTISRCKFKHYCNFSCISSTKLLSDVNLNIIVTIINYIWVTYIIFYFYKINVLMRMNALFCVRYTRLIVKINIKYKKQMGILK